MGWLTGLVGVGGLDHDGVLRLLADREAVARAEVLRLEQESARITALIERGRWEADRLATAREVVSGLLEDLPGVVSTGRGVQAAAVVEQQLLAVLVETARPGAVPRRGRCVGC